MPHSSVSIPTLETARLVLRGHREDDFEAMVAIWQDPIVRKYFHGPALTREDVWARFLKNIGMWALRGYGLWAVEEKASGTYAGAVGIFDVKREMTPPIEGMPEAGWTITPRLHGRGYATEAVQAALSWTDNNLINPSLFCIVAPANVPSLRVAEKCGFLHCYEILYEGEPTMVLKRAPGEDGKHLP